MNTHPWKLDDDDDDESDCPDCEGKEEGKKEESLEKKLQESFLKNRRVFLWGQVDDKSAKEVVARLLYLDTQSHDDIVLLVNSPGGVITAGTAILDAMDAVKSEVVTVVIGQAASMGAVIAAYGKKGKRYAWKRSRIMIHQPLISGTMYGPASDIQIQAEEMLRIRKELNQLLADAAGKTLEQLDADTDRDNIMTSGEALEYGLVDAVQNYS
ncbi:MAG TPA: ATP-dependent Clp protease proteolytic subunit [Fibrobacteria bacterium]|nr:ATP-dependent Clp protease proteolytic subunit [Fibrobacteria bacterium]